MLLPALLTYSGHIVSTFPMLFARLSPLVSGIFVWKAGNSNRLTPHSARGLAHLDVGLGAHVVVGPTPRVVALVAGRITEEAIVGPGRP